MPPFGEPWWTFKTKRIIKLYNRCHIRIPDHPAWDQFTPAAGETIGKLGAPLLHYQFTSIEHTLAKLNRNSSVRARDTELKSRPVVVARIFLGMPLYFFKEYVLSGLFKGGTYGFAYAITIAFGRWLKDVKMYERHMNR